MTFFFAFFTANKSTQIGVPFFISQPNRRDLKHFEVRLFFPRGSYRVGLSFALRVVQRIRQSSYQLFLIKRILWSLLEQCRIGPYVTCSVPVWRLPYAHAGANCTMANPCNNSCWIFLSNGIYCTRIRANKCKLFD